MHGLITTSRPLGGREAIIQRAIEEAGGIEEYLSRGFLQIKYDPSVLAESVPFVTDGLRRLIDFDQEAFAADVFGYDEVGWKHDSGLYRRNVREQKWFFHCFKETCDRMVARGAPVGKYACFFMTMEDLNQRGLEIARIVSRMFDEYHEANGIPMPCLLADHFVNGYCLTRGLRYLKRERGKADATAHFDRGGCTIHWWGSRQGLIVVDKEEQQHRVLETEYDTVCIFPGKKFGGITEHRYGCGTLHGVIDTERDAGSAEDRFALVTFAHPTLTAAQAQRVKEYDATCDEIEKRCAF